MPVYEFYCPDCHTIFNFLARRVTTERRPDCPRCGRPELSRQVSRFAISKGRAEEPAEGLAGLDEERLTQAMAGLAGEMSGMDENDPRQMAQLMRKLATATGMNLSDSMEEAMRRLEAGEDPELLEQEFEGLLGDDNLDNLFTPAGVKGLRRQYTPPAHDETLYPL